MRSQRSGMVGSLVVVWMVLAVATRAGAVPAPGTDAASETETAARLAATRAAVEQFKARFAAISPALAENLDRLYTADVVFRDPISEAHGLDELRRYFTRFAEVSAGNRFEITDEVVQPGEAAIFWSMVLVDDHGREKRRFQGVSHMKVRDRIYEERDYFDLGEAVYDHVPVVSWLTRLVRSRLD